MSRPTDLPLAQIFRGTCRACRATCGVLMALGRFDWAHERMAYASVGNIEVRVFPRPQPARFILRRGIVGLNAPSPAVTEHPWHPDAMLVLHTDGLRTHWGWGDFPDLGNLSATAAAQHLLRALAKPNDDATVLVVKEARP